jgi:putative inorganic carbon (HCO3(-)) transporter
MALFGFFGPADGRALSHFTGVALGLMAMAVAARTCHDTRRLRAAALMFLVAGLLILAVGVVSMSVHPRKEKFFTTYLFNWLPQIKLGLPGLRRGRVNPNALGATALIFAPLAFALAWGRERAASGVTIRRVAIAAGFVAAFVLVVSESRAAWLAAWITSVAVLWRSRGSVRGRAAAILALMLIPALVGVVEASRGSAAQARLWSDTKASFSQRIPIWNEGIRQLRSSPLGGIGVNQFRHVYASSDRKGFEVAHAHNVLLQIALDVGLIGLAAYLTLIVVLLRRADRIARHARGLAVPVAAGGAVVTLALLMFGLTDVVAFGAKVGVFQWIALGLILAAGRLAEPPALDTPGSAPPLTRID